MHCSNGVKSERNPWLLYLNKNGFNSVFLGWICSLVTRNRLLLLYRLKFGVPGTAKFPLFLGALVWNRPTQLPRCFHSSVSAVRIVSQWIFHLSPPLNVSLCSLQTIATAAYMRYIYHGRGFPKSKQSITTFWGQILTLEMWRCGHQHGSGWAD